MNDRSAIAMRFLEMLPEEAVAPLSEGLLRGQFDLPALTEAFRQ